MSGTHHARPSRQDVLAELAKVKRELEVVRKDVIDERDEARRERDNLREHTAQAIEDCHSVVIAMGLSSTATMGECLERARRAEHAEKLAEAVRVYDAALSSCANDSDKMASHCTAQGHTLDDLYLHMIALAAGEHFVVAKREDK